VIRFTNTTDTSDKCTYITINAIEIPIETKSAHKQPQGPLQLEEEPKEPGNPGENRGHSNLTKAMALALHIGLERTSITKDLGEGIPSTSTEGTNSSQLADEASKDTRNQSPLEEKSISSMDIEQCSKDTKQRRKKLDDMVHHTRRDFQTENHAEMNRLSEHRAGKQQQSYPVSLMHTPTTTIVKEDFAVDNDVQKSKNNEKQHSLQRRFGGTHHKLHTTQWIAQ